VTHLHKSTIVIRNYNTAGTGNYSYKTYAYTNFVRKPRLFQLHEIMCELWQSYIKFKIIDLKLPNKMEIKYLNCSYEARSKSCALDYKK